MLCYGQAWALRAPTGRLGRHLIVWGFATFTMTSIAALILDLQHAPDSTRSRGLGSIVVVAGALALLALTIGLRWRAQVQEAPDHRSAALTLAGVHSAVVIGGGAVGVAVLLFLLLLGS